MKKKKLYNTKRRLSIAPGVMKDFYYWSSKKRPDFNAVIFFKDGKHLRFSHDQNSPHYGTRLPSDFLQSKVFGVSIQIPKSKKWTFRTSVFDENGKSIQFLGVGSRRIEENSPKKALKTGIIELREYYVRLNKTLMRTPEQELEDLLKSRDWWATMSDSYSTWARGAYEAEETRRLMKEVGKDKAFELWDKYAPKDLSRNLDDLFPEPREIKVGDLFAGRNKTYLEVMKVNRGSLVVAMKFTTVGEARPPYIRVAKPKSKWNQIKRKGEVYTLLGT